MEGPSETDSSRGNFHLGNTVGHGFGTEQVVPLSALDHTGHSSSALLVLPSSSRNEQYESSSMSTLVTHDQGSGEVVIIAQDNSLPENGNSVAENIPGTTGMSSLPNSVSPVVDNGQNSSRKRSVQDDRDRSQLRIDVPISHGHSARLSRNSSRNVSRRTVVSDQERGHSSPVVPPTNVQLSHSRHRGDARLLHAVELSATAMQVPGNVFGRDVGDLQMGTVGRTQAPANLASLINHASCMYDRPNIQNGGLHLSHQTTANTRGRTSTVGSPFEVSPPSGAFSPLIGYHLDLLCSLSPLGQAFVLLAPPTEAFISRFVHHLRALSMLPYDRQSSILAELMRVLAEYFAEANGNGVASAEWWRAAAQREVEHETMRLNVEHMSYEGIVALEELVGDANTRLSEEAIHTHINQHRHPVSHLDPRITPESCTICLDNFEKGQNVGKLDCTHKFHFECIKTWLLRNNSCPLCKAPAVPTP